MTFLGVPNTLVIYSGVPENPQAGVFQALNMGLYKNPVPFCLTRKVVIVLFSSYRFFQVLGVIVLIIVVFFLLSFLQLKHHVLHFAAHQDIILWRGVIIQPHMQFSRCRVKGVGRLPQNLYCDYYYANPDFLHDWVLGPSELDIALYTLRYSYPKP